eukprot:UN34197
MPRLKSLLRAYSKCNPKCHNDLTGIVQIVAVLTAVVDDDSQAFEILQVLGELITPYFRHDHLRNETLILVEVLYSREGELCEHLTQVGFDLIDICDIVRAWVQPLFTHHFPLEFVLRVLDVVFLEGPSVLLAIVYGILNLFKVDLIHFDDSAKLFNLFLIFLWV